MSKFARFPQIAAVAISFYRNVLSCGRKIWLFRGDRRANVAMIFGLAVLPMMGAMGLAIDGGRAYLVHARMAKALDAAGLAAARVANSDRAEEDARRFFDANFPDGYLGSTVVDFDYNIDDENFVTVSAQADMPTVLMHLVGFEALDVGDAAVIERLNRGLELALVMDNTGSMRHPWSKIAGMRDAATSLVNILFGGEDELERLWISVVPYTATVNVGEHRTDWLLPSDRARQSPSGFAPTKWKGCVEARDGGDDERDDPPADNPFDSFFYASHTDNYWDLDGGKHAIDEANERKNNGRGPNLGCGPAITSLTNVKQTVLDAIAEMLPWHRGGTTSNLGMVWGWRTLSPRWQGLWGGATPADMPFDRDEPLMDKAVILLTDGDNQFYDHGASGPGGSDYTAYGRLNDLGYTSLGGGKDDLDERLSRTCGAMKAQDIIVYTITFGSSPDSATRELYRTCATENANYFHAPNADTLTSAFEAIGQRLSNLRVVE